MEQYLIISVVCVVVAAVLSFLLGKRQGKGNDNSQLLAAQEESISQLNAKCSEQETEISRYIQTVTSLTSERDVQKTTAENLGKQFAEYREETKRQQEEERARFEKDIAEQKAYHEAALRNQAKEMKDSAEAHVRSLKESHEEQLRQVKEAFDKQLDSLREMNKKQVEAQLTLIREQMKSTSETVLKARQDELGERNKEQVSKIIDPLQRTIKDMQEALDKNKEQQNEALTRLDETIKISMQKSMALGETADRLTRALTGEVKVQGNFGELKLKQLLEDLELKEGEQFDTQETLRDKSGKAQKGEEGKGLIPDFILHFPNNRHVVVDAKMSLTDYERYMNSEDEEEKSRHLTAHISSVRAQVKRLAKKDYTSYLPSGYNKLNFAIMYVPIEGALNLALLNDSALWREAYDMGVMILGPQTMYMNLRVLEMMWTQVKQLKNQQAMMDAANAVIERVQDFGIRFMDVESSMNDTLKKMSRLKITTADSGPSIITAARKLLKAGAKENKKKKGIEDISGDIFIDSDDTLLLTDEKDITATE